jgi:hypothetical protein
MIVQRLSLHAVCATAREQITLDVDGTEVIFARPKQHFHSNETCRRMGASKF